VDAGSVTTTVKLAAADGTWTTAAIYTSPGHDGLGAYHQDVSAADVNTIGHYQYAVVTTGAGAGVQPGELGVRRLMPVAGNGQIQALDIRVQGSQIRVRAQVTVQAQVRVRPPVRVRALVPGVPRGGSRVGELAGPGWLAGWREGHRRLRR